MKKKKIALFIWLGVLIMFVGCEVKVAEKENIYNRKYVNNICTYENFGNGKTDDI